MAAAVTLGPRNSLDGGVIALGAAACEYNLVRPAAQQIGDPNSSRFNGLLCLHAVGMAAGRIAEVFV